MVFNFDQSACYSQRDGVNTATVRLLVSVIAVPDPLSCTTTVSCINT